MKIIKAVGIQGGQKNYGQTKNLILAEQLVSLKFNKTECFSLPFYVNSQCLKRLLAEFLDGVSVNILKSGSPLLSHILSFFFNNSAWQGTKRLDDKTCVFFLSEGIQTIVTTIVQFSILPIVMKVFEKIVDQQISDYGNPFTNFQSGFRKQYSTTDTTVLEVTNFILNEVDKGKHIGAVG